MHLRHSVKRKTAMLIQPSKPPVMPPEERPLRMELPLPVDEDNDYESMLHIPADV